MEDSSFKSAIFLAPKVYYLKDINNLEIIKIKGVTKKAIIENNIGENMFKSLLYRDSGIQLKQQKWYKNIIDANITIKDQIYSLKVTENKRELVFDYNNMLVSTKPFLYSSIETKG